MRSTGPGQPAHLVLDVVEILDRLGVPCAIVGALAVSYHGAPRATNDGDAAAWLKGTTLTPEDLLARCREAGFAAELNRGEPEDPIAAVLVVRDAHSNRVDLLLGVRGMDPDAPSRAVATSLLDTPVRMISAEDLIAMKLFAGGFQDLEDARAVLRVNRARLDLALLKRLARRYGAAEAKALEKLLKDTAR